MLGRAILNHSALLCVLLAIGACGESVAPTAQPPALRIETRTTGDSLDGNGYIIAIDSVPLPDRMLPNDARVVGGLPLRRHSLTLSDVDGQCVPRGGTTLTLPISVSERGDTLTFRFWVTCARALSRVDGRIVFETDRNVDWDIYAIREDGTDLVNLTNNGWSNRYPAVSPDGFKMAFLRSIGGGEPGCPAHEFSICFAVRVDRLVPYVMNVDRTGLRQLAPDGMAVRSESPRWSPDGSQIAFFAEGLVVVNADGTGYRALTSPRTAWSPAWSPDGKRIAFIAASDSRFPQGAGLYVSNLNGGITMVTDRASIGSFAWSPDGTRFAFSAEAHSPSDPNYTYSGLFVVNADGLEETELSGFRYFPAWSPDGTMIASVGPSYLEAGIFIINADGTEEWQLPSDGPVTAFAWSPDGTKLAFESNQGGTSDIYTISLDGSKLRNLTGDPSRDRLPTWSRPR